ncbi:MAG TPA: DUF3426 domain-containing protein [Burkholderiales bacterium]|nr:DUF3426 domain-containing protein [Burkholderiales bacterium]
MSLVTRCQVCATAFRVQRAQLAARGGKVRCGKCGTVFDGVAGLVEEGNERLRLEPSPQLGLFDPRRRPAGAGREPNAGAMEQIPLPEFLAKPERPHRSTFLWGCLVVVAACVLAAQAAYRFRTEIAVVVPPARPWLVEACRRLGCELRLPHRPELMSIESSDLQADPRAQNVIVLNAVLRNRAPFAQEYPALELTLTDEADKPVLRRVLLPSQYLDRARAATAAQGFAGGAEASFRVNLDAGRTRATGYRLYLFYPK